MEKAPLNKLVDGLVAALNEFPLDEEGNPVWDLPAYIEDDLSSEFDNPLGNLLRGSRPRTDQAQRLDPEATETVRRIPRSCSSERSFPVITNIHRTTFGISGVLCHSTIQPAMRHPRCFVSLMPANSTKPAASPRSPPPTMENCQRPHPLRSVSKEQQSARPHSRQHRLKEALLLR